jgi:hypothetical protein
MSLARAHGTYISHFEFTTLPRKIEGVSTLEYLILYKTISLSSRIKSPRGCGIYYSSTYSDIAWKKRILKKEHRKIGKHGVVSHCCSYRSFAPRASHLLALRTRLGSENLISFCITLAFFLSQSCNKKMGNFRTSKREAAT